VTLIRVLRFFPETVALLRAMVDEADHIDTVIAKAAVAYGLTEEKTR
jgi:hypothetical protein